MRISNSSEIRRRRDGHLPGVHTAERGPRRRALQLERVAVDEAGDDAARRAARLLVQSDQGAARLAAASLRSGHVLAQHVPRHPQSLLSGGLPRQELGVQLLLSAQQLSAPVQRHDRAAAGRRAHTPLLDHRVHAPSS